MRSRLSFALFWLIVGSFLGLFHGLAQAGEPTVFPQVLIARGSEWRYLDLGVDPGPGWTQPGYADSSWLSGPAELGFGDGGGTDRDPGGDHRQLYHQLL